MRSPFRGRSRHMLYPAVMIAGLLALPSVAMANEKTEYKHELSVLGSLGLIFFALATVALIILSEKKDWSLNRRRALAVVVFIGLIAGLAFIDRHAHFVVWPMLGLVLLVLGAYGLYKVTWGQPAFEFWMDSTMPDADRDTKRDQEREEYDEKLKNFRLLYAGLTAVGLVLGTVLMYISDVHVVW